MKKICVNCNEEIDGDYCFSCQGISLNKYSGTSTEKNIMIAFSVEAQTRVKYEFFSTVAKNEGYVEISKLFTEVANNELAHAKIWFEELCGICTTLENLKSSSKTENEEWSNMYLEFAETAKKEGFNELAYKFKGVAEIEKNHEKIFLDLLHDIEKNEVFKKEEVMIWECSNCGHKHSGKYAQEVCPVCNHPKSYFKISNN